jgi:hypothetical protein
VIAARQGRLGYNVKLLLEMGEEVGSPGLRELCAAQAERLRADLFLASDGPRLHAESPTLFLGSRGIANFTLRLRCRERAYHSGNWGGVLTNPAVVVAHAITSLMGRHGAMRVDALQPPPIDAQVRAALAGIVIGTGADDPACDPALGAPPSSAMPSACMPGTPWRCWPWAAVRRTARWAPSRPRPWPTARCVSCQARPGSNSGRSCAPILTPTVSRRWRWWSRPPRRPPGCR